MTTLPMNPVLAPADPAKTRRIELILRQIDGLPTLPAVAMRLLALTSDEQSEASQVVEVLRCDPALTSRILSISRRADLGLREEAVTLDKAVVLLGFTAVRNAVLSIKVFEMFRSDPRPEVASTEPQPDATGAGVAPGHPGTDLELDRPAFWRHCLATALAAEQLAKLDPRHQLNPDEAFVCGLLHDIGKLALDFVLPKSFGRVVELVALNQGNIAEFERRIIGIDHHTAGKRLAEQWCLPHLIQDCIWLHGCPYELLPKLEHRRMVGLISLADLVARRMHLGYSGNFSFPQEEGALARALELPADASNRIGDGLHTLLEARCRTLGLDEQPSRELFLQSIQQANQMLGRLNLALERRGRLGQRQTQLLDAIVAFHGAALPGRSVEDVLSQAVVSATSVLGPGYYAMVYQASARDQWLVCQYNAEGRPTHSQFIPPPSTCPDLSRLDAAQPASLNLMGIMPILADCLPQAPDLRQLRILPLGSGWGTAALLIHDRPNLPPWTQLQALTHSWGAAIAEAGQYDGARRLGEQLAQANSALAEAQDRLLQSESLARLGEMAAGAANEMNNPLAVISGRAQLLAQILPRDSKEQQAARTITEQAHRLSEMISLMRLRAETPQAQRRPQNLRPLLEEAVKEAQGRFTPGPVPVAVQVSVQPAPLTVPVDAGQLRTAVAELVHNALGSQPHNPVRLSARLEAGGAILVLEISDDGQGMDSHTLAHAMDPFFSSKAAGRQPGMGLPKAQLLAAAHGGRVELRSQVGQGTTAVLLIPLETPNSDPA